MLITSIKEKYNTEIALVVLCCRHFIQTADDNAIRIFLQVNKIDWKRFYQLCAAHRIRPVIYKTLFGFKEVIEEVNLTEFRNYCMYLNAFALNNKRELYRIVELLRQNSISVKPYKGIDFSENFYGDIGLREFSDNDLIIMTSDIEGIVNIMNKEGYSSKGLAFYKKFPKQFVRDYKDITFEKWTGKSRDFAIEFHFKPGWSFQYPFTFNEILGKDHLNQLTYNANQYLALITLSNGLMDYYPNIRSLLDLALIFKKAEHSIINNFDPILSEYLHCGKQISFNVLEYPNIQPQVSGTYNGNNFCHYLQNNLLIMNAGKRIKALQYMYINLKYIGPMKYKLWQFKNFIFYIIRPKWVDIEYIDLPYYFLYYFTRPFRILIRGK